MKILMCRPDYFDIEYVINAWMDLNNQVDPKKALEQWESLYETYQQLGVEVELINPIKGLPDMVFTANAGVVRGNLFVSGNFRYQERKGEEPYFQKWFKDHGYEIKELQHFQGGEGDALFYKDVLYMGYGFRSDIESHHELGRILGVKTVSLHLINKFYYDFDTAFCVVGDKGIIYYPDAFDEGSNKILAKLDHAVQMTKTQAEHFIGNSVYVDGKLLVSFLDEDLKRKLDGFGVTPILLDLTEYKKSGGGIKCLTLYLNERTMLNI